LNKLVPHISPSLAAVVERALERKPARRYQSAGEMAAALRVAQDALGAPGHRSYSEFLYGGADDSQQEALTTEGEPSEWSLSESVTQVILQSQELSSPTQTEELGPEQEAVVEHPEPVLRPRPRRSVRPWLWVTLGVIVLLVAAWGTTLLSGQEKQVDEPVAIRAPGKALDKPKAAATTKETSPQPEPKPVTPTVVVAPPKIRTEPPVATRPMVQPPRPGPVEPKKRPRKRVVAKSGTLRLDSDPWSHVYLGDKKLGMTPLLNETLPVGRHKLRLVNPELDLAKEITVTIRSNRITKQIIRLDHY
jgi:serine/threonine-protein kinase